MAGDNNSLREISYFRLPCGEREPACHVPFWRVRAETPGVDVDSLADLVRFANLPVVSQTGWKNEPVEYWVPAFTASPDQFLRFARTMTIARPGLVPAGRQHEAETMAKPGPVTLPPSCLANAVKILLADLGQPKTAVFPRVAGVAPRITRAELVYVPLADNGPEFVHQESQLTVQKNVLRSLA